MQNARSVSCSEKLGTHRKIQVVLHLLHGGPCCGSFQDEGDECSTEQVQYHTKVLGGLSVWCLHNLFLFNIDLKRMKREGGRDWLPRWVECSFLPLTVLRVLHIHCCKKSGLWAGTDTMDDICPSNWAAPWLILHFDWILYCCWRKGVSSEQGRSKITS